VAETPDKLAVDRELVAAMADLARLRLPDDEIDRTAADLARILGHFQAIGEVDTDGVAPLTHVLATHGTPGPDEVVTFPDARAALTALTDHAREGFFVVPRVLDDAESPASDDDPDGDPADEHDDEDELP
jgi:aspartyl-tRNA(Asn)/glutamyl-tRNA(Gln) amidotransferase subunit C